MKGKVRVILIAAVWLAFVGIMFGIWFKGHRIGKAEVPVRTEIERAIKVGQLENKFVFARAISFGGAGGGGLGAPMVICSSAQQFVDLVPKDEPIYVAFEFPVVKESYGYDTNREIKKVYWAFIENRAGIMVWEDGYSYQKGNDRYWVESYTPDTIYFYFDNSQEMVGVMFMAVVLGAIIAGMITFFINTELF